MSGQGNEEAIAPSRQPDLCSGRHGNPRHEYEGDVVTRANATPYGLAAGVFTRDLTRAHRVAARLDAGVVWINHYNVTPVAMPFGGRRLSGLGRENGKAAIAQYTELKSVYIALGDIESPY
jgi:betaine-aldehyde dehydrogenase